LSTGAPKQPPPFEEVQEQVRTLLLREAYFEAVQDMRDAADHRRAGRGTARRWRGSGPTEEAEAASTRSRHEVPTIAMSAQPHSLRSHQISYPDMPPIEGCASPPPRPASSTRAAPICMVMTFDEGTEAAGVFTRSKCPSAPVDWCRHNLPGGQGAHARGQFRQCQCLHRPRGAQATALTATAAAAAAAAPMNEVFLASTGVIGEPLEAERFSHLLDGLTGRAGRSAGRGRPAIMTTDTYPKWRPRRSGSAGADVTINGIAKGAGMIAPDMATMLSFVATDAPIGARPAGHALGSAAPTFNAVTVDSDTSTSDTLMLFSPPEPRPARARPAITMGSRPALAPSARARTDLLKIAGAAGRARRGRRTQADRDQVTGAKSTRSAKRIALSIANSPLVKTAVAGEDANWGRVVMAVGKAGEPADRDRCRSGSAISASPTRANATQTIRRQPSPPI
jgi:glutamate N-acetyltransferase / amino-acid N-acetyltransferase